MEKLEPRAQFRRYLMKGKMKSLGVLRTDLIENLLKISINDIEYNTKIRNYFPINNFFSIIIFFCRIWRL